jgi:hypothetical protein
MKDAERKPGARIDIAGGWFINRLMAWFLVWFLRGSRGLRRFGQS